MKKLLLTLAAAAAFQTLAIAADKATFEVGHLTFTRPEGWKQVEIQPGMRAAQLEVPGKEGLKPGEVVFFRFPPGVGGGVQANVDRWLSQFEGPKDKLNSKTEKVAVGKSEVTYVEAHGTYLQGLPGGPKTPMPGHALLGAIVESADGNIFIRFTAPKAVADGAKAEFRKLVESPLK